MNNKKNFRVAVTYGTVPNQTYAQVPTRESAEALRRTAVRLGYDDARIEETKDEETVGQGAQEVRRGDRHQKKPHYKAR